MEKLEYYTRTRLEELRNIDKTCRDLMAERKVYYSDLLNHEKTEAIQDMRECREDYISELLEFKEALKEKLQELLNQTIWDIKEMKVEGLLNEAGIPTEEHKTTLDNMITDRIEQFNTESGEICSVEWEDRVLDAETGRQTEFQECVEMAKEDYDNAYNDDENEGYANDFFEEYKVCYDQMKDFKDEARIEL